MRALLLSTYDMGRQPFGLASPAAWLREEGFEVECRDLSRTPLDSRQPPSADLVAWFLPMHTATRLAGASIRRLRAAMPDAVLVAYGVYAPLNATWLAACGIDVVLGGEFEEDLLSLARRVSPQAPAAGRRRAEGSPVPDGGLPRLRFRVPDRTTLPPLERYAHLVTPEGPRLAGYTEASRGCKHLCRHCPIVPVYAGRFRVVPIDVVRADVAQQVAAGARHITFGDPDFFNGIGHARAVIAMMRELAGVTFDVTIKISHLIRHAGALGALAEAGCAFVTSAVEALDDETLARLDKGHTREDVVRAVELCREAGLTLSPTFVPFTPWTATEGYLELLDAIAGLDLVEQVAPIQLAIRLLLPEGSRLLDLPEIQEVAGAFDGEQLCYPWRHRDPAVDRLADEVFAVASRGQGRPRGDLFAEIYAVACRRAGRTAIPPQASRARATIPYLNEPWYC